MPEHDTEPHGTGTTPAVARFYDTLRRGALSAAALAHGTADIGQECVLTPEAILAFARRVGITAGTSVLDIGSGTGGPACYLAQQLGCRILGVDISAVGHTQALARARAAALSHLVQFQHGDIATLTLPEAAFDVMLGLDGMRGVTFPSVPGSCPSVRRCSDHWGVSRSMITWCASRCLPRRTSTFAGCGGFLGSKPRRVTGRRCRPAGSASSSTTSPRGMRCASTPACSPSTANGAWSLQRCVAQHATRKASSACR
jgi:SAM-dependent methyltransferase